MNRSDEQLHNLVARKAGEWFVANQGGSLDAAERGAFVAWLKASPLHVEEYLGIALTARDLRAAANHVAVPVDVLLEQAAADESDAVAALDQSVAWSEPAAASDGAGTRWPMAAILAASLTFFVATALWFVNGLDFLHRPEIHRTTHGEQRVALLPDGTRLNLNSDSEAAVRYSMTERFVDLHRGEALFDVSHDDTRPFRVKAGTAQVVAVGTRFNVERRTGQTVVTVVAGRVDVFAHPLARSAADSGSQRIGAGYQLRIDDVTGPAQPVRVDLDRELGWLQRRIAFENRPLGEVADEFNRYAKVPLAIEDQALRALPISGVFDAYDTDSFITFLATFEGVRVERTPARIFVRRSRMTDQEVPTVR